MRCQRLVILKQDCLSFAGTIQADFYNFGENAVLDTTVSPKSHKMDWEDLELLKQFVLYHNDINNVCFFSNKLEFCDEKTVFYRRSDWSECKKMNIAFGSNLKLFSCNFNSIKHASFKHHVLSKIYRNFPKSSVDVFANDYDESLQKISHLNLPNKDFVNDSKILNDNIFIYDSSLVQLVVEEDVYLENIYSKVSLEALGSRKPLLFLGPKGMISSLKSDGFRTFNFFIDETYDDLDSFEDRVNHVFQEIQKIKHIPESDWLNIDSACENIYNANEHNQDVLKDKFLTTLNSFNEDS
jgi:hypothetical protein